MDYRLVRTIAGKGDGPGRFRESLNGIVLDASGRLLAVGDRSVMVFGEDGSFIRQWATERPGYCVAISAGGAAETAAPEEATVFVGEAGQIELFDMAGKQRARWRDAEKLGSITSIGFAGEAVLAADTRGRCIRRLDRNGRWQADLGIDNNTKGFLIPNGYLDFCVDRDGVIHCANPGKFRVERYDVAGKKLGHFGRYGTHEPEEFRPCCNPTNVTLSREGNVIVTEKAGPRVKIFDPAGGLITVVAEEPFDPLAKNMDVAVDDSGRIYVADTVKLSILVFEPVGGSPR